MGIVGTMMYQAPEHLDPTLKSESGVKSDIWSVGLTVLEIAIARFPTETDILFDPENKSSYDVISNIYPPSKSRFPREFIEFCSKCLTRIPVERPRASELMVSKIKTGARFHTHLHA